MVAGGPPCQPFSLGGKHRAHQDGRDMFPEAVRAVRELRPRCFIFENVKGLLRQSFASYFSYVVLQLTYPLIARRSSEGWESHLSRLEKLHTSARRVNLSYRVVCRLLDAASYGVPQHRHRVFLVGFRSDLGKEWSFPSRTHSLDRLLWDQWVTGEYWDEHQVSRSRRPGIPPQLRSRVERLAAEHKQCPPAGLRFRTVRDALLGLPDPRDSQRTFANHEYRPGARRTQDTPGASWTSPPRLSRRVIMVYPAGRTWSRCRMERADISRCARVRDCRLFQTITSLAARGQKR